MQLPFMSSDDDDRFSFVWFSRIFIGCTIIIGVSWLFVPDFVNFGLVALSSGSLYEGISRV